MAKLNTRQDIEVDKEGFLRNLSDWNPQVAEQLAAQDNITLTDEHWEIINLVQDYYQRFNISPAMRVLVKVAQEKLGKKKGRSIHLMLLFPGTPAKLISKIAGLPKPDNCD